MLRTIIAIACALGLVAAAGCAKKTQAPVNSGHYSAHPYHGGKMGKV